MSLKAVIAYVENLAAQPAVIDFVSELPGSPSDGDRYILTEGEKEDYFAMYIEGDWHYYPPKDGMTVWCGGTYQYDNGWQLYIPDFLQIKDDVKVATTEDITLSGEKTITDVSVETGDRVLVRKQSDASENGIYVVDSGSWSRSSDTDSWEKMVAAYTLVMEGDYANVGWLCSITAGGDLGTDNIHWSQFTRPGDFDMDNVGSGEGVFKNRVGSTFRLRRLRSVSSALTIEQGTSEVDFDVNTTALETEPLPEVKFKQESPPDPSDVNEKSMWLRPSDMKLFEIIDAGEPMWAEVTSPKIN